MDGEDMRPVSARVPAADAPLFLPPPPPPPKAPATGRGSLCALEYALLIVALIALLIVAFYLIDDQALRGQVRYIGPLLRP